MDNDRRKELKLKFQQIKTYMGVFKITNKENGKVFVDSFTNLKNRWMLVQMHLDSGFHHNMPLQEDWNKYGKDAFSYEVLEQKDISEFSNPKMELKKMEKEWLDMMRPYGEKGYNKEKL